MFLFFMGFFAHLWLAFPFVAFVDQVPLISRHQFVPGDPSLSAFMWVFGNMVIMNAALGYLNPHPIERVHEAHLRAGMAALGGAALGLTLGVVIALWQLGVRDNFTFGGYISTGLFDLIIFGLISHLFGHAVRHR